MGRAHENYETINEKHAADTTNLGRSTQPTARMHHTMANHPATRHQNQNKRRTPDTPEVRSKVTRRGGRSTAWEEFMKMMKEPTRNTQQTRQTMCLPPNRHLGDRGACRRRSCSASVAPREGGRRRGHADGRHHPRSIARLFSPNSDRRVTFNTLPKLCTWTTPTAS